jgi:ATP-dependent Clp protease protease subunit
MRHRKLLNLLARNAKKGEFRAESGDAGNVIYVYDVIVASEADAEWLGGVAADTFVKTLAGMSGDVSIRVNSPGGDVFGAKAMAQAMREYAGSITVHVDGYAASAATFLTSVADKTIVAPGAMLMIHKAWTIELGNADDFKATAALLEKIDGTIAETYSAAAERRGKEPTDFNALMKAETWLTAQEALDVGLADELADDAPKAKVDWDLSAYDHAPKQASTVTVKIDASEVRGALDAALEQMRAELGLGAPKENPIEPQRPDIASELLLRPAA